MSPTSDTAINGGGVARSATVPIKSRNNNDDKAAAAALASLSGSASPITKPSSIKREPEHPSGNNALGVPIKDDLSDSEESYTSQNDVLPKEVHKPKLNNMMVNHTYIDYSVIKEKDLGFLEADEVKTILDKEEQLQMNKRIAKIRTIFGEVGPSKKNSGGVVRPFPEKLMEVLDRGDMESIITWMPHGRAFIVLNPQQLRDVVLPRFFKQTKFMSFTRQLNLWGFKRITKGIDCGAYYHALFLRGHGRLAMLMRRQKIKGTGIKLTPNPDGEPNFYEISEKRPLPVIDQSKKETKPLPPLRQPIPSRGVLDPTSPAVEYNRIVGSLRNGRQSQNIFDHQIYPFSNPSENLSSNSLGLVSSQGLGLTNVRENFRMHLPDLLQQQRQHLQQQNDAEYLNYLRQKAYLEQQQWEQERQQHQLSMASTQLLNRYNTTTHSPHPSESFQIQELKQRLLNAGGSLDRLDQPRNLMMRQESNLMAPPSHLVPSLMSQQGQQHQHRRLQDNDNIAVLMDALENTRNVAFAAQVRLEELTRNIHDSQQRRSL